MSQIKRHIEYTTEPLEGGRAYIECQVGDLLVFIVDSKAEALLEPWVRQEMWNRIFAVAENPKMPKRTRQHNAEIIDIDDLREQRMRVRSTAIRY